MSELQNPIEKSEATQDVGSGIVGNLNFKQGILKSKKCSVYITILLVVFIIGYFMYYNTPHNGTKYINGAKYVGVISKGKANGYGTATLVDGSKMIGNFKDDKSEGGEVILLFQDGRLDDLDDIFLGLDNLFKSKTKIFLT